MRALTELERLRASDVVKATILRESKQQAADARNYEEQAHANAHFYSEQKAADARAYMVKIETEARYIAASKDAEAELTKQQKAADASAYMIKIEAEARYIAASKDAEAELIKQQKRAAGLSSMASAYADLAQAFGGPAGLVQYLMIEKGVYTDLAQANANAVRGLNPKMTIWNTGSQAGGETGAAGGQGGIDSIRNMYQMLPPLMSTINEQTGVTLPEWQFGKLAEKISEGEASSSNGKRVNGNSVNGAHPPS
ncbi:flotillin domain-containing protein [Diplocarpon rosae]|nr:flotillin domain-containing protein [Diplocarpon rosae]